MKRTTALILALFLAVSLAVPAMAEEPEQQEGTAQEPNVVLWEIDEPEEAPAEEVPAPEDAPEEPASAAEEVSEEELTAGLDAALAELVLQVKKTLDVDDGYTELTNDFYDGVSPYWSLSWSDETRQLNVNVREDGTVLNVNRWTDSGDTDRFYGFDPAFPALSRQEAEEQAEEWLSRLFAEPETARVDSVATVLGTSGNYRFSGTVLINGLPGPTTFSLCVDGTGLSSFYRSDSYGGYVGEIPAPEAAADETAAAEGLAGAVELELRWVSDGEGGASLRYVPVGPTTVVDAQSGEAVDMDALYAGFGGNGWNTMDAKDAAAETVAMADGGASLTEMELASIDNYGDVMDQDGIDASLRGLTALGLDPFTLQLCSYSMDRESGDVTASLSYTAPMTGEELYGYSKSGFDLSSDMELDLIIHKNITLNAKTGALIRVSTTYPLWEKDPAVTMTQAVRTRAAENFLSLAAPELVKETELCTLKGYNDGDSLLYAQVHEGYFYPDNYLSVTVNPSTGTVDAFTCAWDDDVQFGSAKEPVRSQEALEAYTGALDVTLGYVAWPVDIALTDNELYASLLEQGYTYVEELRLAYYYDGTDRVLGVDGLTGETVTVPDGQAGQVFVYDDLKDVPQAEQIEALGQAGVGFAGGSFRPEAELTQREAVILLLQADGETILPEAEDGDLLDRASWRGFVTAEDWEPDKTVTRMEFIRMVLCVSRYGDAAKLLNDKADEGYEAIAQALGMDTAEPDGPATRAAAAEMLYRFMDR